MNSFTVKLPENRRTLESITFPDGNTRQVQYMRDGIITFTAGPGATYERQGDSVVITPVGSFAQARDAAGEYLKRMGRL